MAGDVLPAVKNEPADVLLIASAMSPSGTMVSLRRTPPSAGMDAKASESSGVGSKLLWIGMRIPIDRAGGRAGGKGGEITKLGE